MLTENTPPLNLCWNFCRFMGKPRGQVDRRGGGVCSERREGERDGSDALHVDGVACTVMIRKRVISKLLSTK